MSGDASSPPICDYENSTYRTDFWEGQGREYEDLAERAALHKLLPKSGKCLIDVGAGFGRLADLYDAFEHVILLDYSHSQLAYARQRLGDERFTYVAADIYRLPLADNAVDTQVMVRVMHHLADVPRALQQLHRILLPSGTSIIEYANKRHLKNRIRHLLGQFPDLNRPEPFEFAPLHYDFHPRWIEQELRAVGFRPREALSVSLYRSRLLKKALGAALLARLDGWQQRGMAPLTISPSIFVRSKSAGGSQAVLASADDLFICPDCGSGLLVRTQEGLVCQDCGRLWPIVDGVYVFK